MTTSESNLRAALSCFPCTGPRRVSARLRRERFTRKKRTCGVYEERAKTDRDAYPRSTSGSGRKMERSHHRGKLGGI